MSIRKPLTVPFGTILAVVFVVAGVSAVAAQTGFGVQRLSNGSRFSLLPANAAQYPNPLQPAGTETAVPARNTKPSGESQSSRSDKDSPPIASVVRLIAFEKGGQSFGSGSYIGNSGEYGLILSNWHVIKDGDGLLHVHFPNGFSTFGAVIDSDKTWDLAIIVTSKPPNSVVPIPISRTIPVPGEPLWIAGHGSGAYRLAGGRCVRYLAPEMPSDGSRPIEDILELSVSARQGDSGGPILNQNGELAGVLFGSDMIRNTAGSHCGRASQFLSQALTLLSRLPAQPEVYFASIEKNGPRRQLRETVNFVPVDTLVSAATPSAVDVAGSSSSTFGVRSNSRRYVQNGSATEKAPSPPPSPGSSSETLGNPPSVPPAVPPPGPIQKAVWNPTGGSAPSVPPMTSGGAVVQTGLSAEVGTRPTVPRDPFTEDLSALNPMHESESSHRIVQENLQFADHTTKYAAASHSPYTLSATSSGSQSSKSLPSILLFGVFFLAGVLVMLAIRLIRADAEVFENEEKTAEMSLGGRQRSQAA